MIARTKEKVQLILEKFPNSKILLAITSAIIIGVIIYAVVLFLLSR